MHKCNHCIYMYTCICEAPDFILIVPLAQYVLWIICERNLLMKRMDKRSIEYIIIILNPRIITWIHMLILLLLPDVWFLFFFLIIFCVFLFIFREGEPFLEIPSGTGKYQVEEQPSLCRSCFEQAGGRILGLCLEMWQCLSRSFPEQRFREHLFPCALVPSCRIDPAPGWCHPSPLSSFCIILSEPGEWRGGSREGI